MPDETQPATPTTTEAPSAPAETAAAEDVYNSAAAELLTDNPSPATESDPGDETQEAAAPTTEPAEQAPEPTGLVLTTAEENILKRAKVDPALIQGWSREQVDGFVSWAREQQANLDKLGAELGNLKGQKPEQSQPPASPQAPATPKAGSYAAEIEAVIGKLGEALDEEPEAFKPLGSLLGRLNADLEAARETASTVPIAIELMTDLVVDSLVDSLKTDYPSITTKDTRDKVVARFWQEWKTGEYTGKGSLRSDMAEAMRNAAKVTLVNTTEAQAAAALVLQNKGRVASQPKVPTGTPRTAPATADDVYAQAFEQTIGRELAQR